jgi:predicted nucleic acid-binding Zn ribbon protein
MQILEKKLCKNCGAVIIHKENKTFCSKKCLKEWRGKEWKRYLKKRMMK